MLWHVADVPPLDPELLVLPLDPEELLEVPPLVDPELPELVPAPQPLVQRVGQKLPCGTLQFGPPPLDDGPELDPDVAPPGTQVPAVVQA